MGGCTNKAVKIVASEQFDLRKPGVGKGHPKVGRRVEVNILDITLPRLNWAHTRSVPYLIT